MKHRGLRRAALIGVAALVMLGVMLSVAAQGDENDPLVTLGYLTGVFSVQMDQKIAEAVDAAKAELSQKLDAAAAGYLAEMDDRLARSDGGASFVTVTLTAGQTLSGKAGIEVVVRSGGAAAAGGLTDVTAGEAVAAGAALAVSHLYIPDAAGAILTTAIGASVMVRGDYTVQ